MSKTSLFIHSFSWQAIIGCMLAAASTFLKWHTAPNFGRAVAEVDGIESVAGKVMFGVSIALTLIMVATGDKASAARWKPALVAICASAFLAYASVPLLFGLHTDIVVTMDSVSTVYPVWLSLEYGFYIAIGIAIALLALSAIHLRLSGRIPEAAEPVAAH